MEPKVGSIIKFEFNNDLLYEIEKIVDGKVTRVKNIKTSKTFSNHFGYRNFKIIEPLNKIHEIW